jgi:hypothetical protein
MGKKSKRCLSQNDHKKYFEKKNIYLPTLFFLGIETLNTHIYIFFGPTYKINCFDCDNVLIGLEQS